MNKLKKQNLNKENETNITSEKINIKKIEREKEQKRMRI